MNLKTKLIISGLGIYLLVTGLSFAVFSVSHKDSSLVSPLAERETAQEEMRVFTGPKDQECPINGAMYTKGQKDVWEKRRPLTAMIENHEDSRPQSGLTKADVIYEAVAEGGITRFMGVYYCQAAEPYSMKYDLGPVRSARSYFLDLASEYGDYPLYLHVGGAHCSAEGDRCTTDPRAQALEQIQEYGWQNKDHWSDMNQFSLSYRHCRREPERTGESRVTEHTMYCDTDALWQEADKRGLGDSGWDENFQLWEFKDEEKADSRGDIANIEFNFWEGYGSYKVTWQYDTENNQYLRYNGGELQKDFVADQDLTAKVVVVQFVKEIGPVDKHKHMLYEVVGKGEALIFQDGEVVQGRWNKGLRQSRTVFTDLRGKEIELNRGLIWIEILPAGNRVNYEST